MTTPVSPSEAVVPWTGERCDLSIPEEAARLLDAARRYQVEYARPFADACAETLREESDRLGQRTFERGGWKVEVESSDSALKTEWDVDKLWEGLLEAGLPVERLKDLVSYEPVVNGMVLRQLRRTPAYAVVIESAVRKQSPRSRYVKVTRGG